MNPLTLGTGQIVPLKKGFLLRFMTYGSFLECERLCLTEQAARDFCRARGIRVI